MRYIRIFLTVTLLGLASAHGSDEGSAEVNPVADGGEIAEIEAMWSDLFGARDLAGIMELMASESVLIMPESPPITGAKGIRQATKAMLESKDSVSWRSDFAFVAPSGDMAYDYGTATTKRPDGSIVQGNYLVVWVKENGEWKVAADMFN